MTRMDVVIGTDVDTGKDVVLDLDYAIEERMEILGGSGSGKSHLVRCICEQTNGRVQQIIISPKKEFVTLREKFDYVHIGTASGNSKPEIELNARYAGQLALKILETGMDAIIEFSENSKERVKYVKNFIEGLLDAPEHLWHPVMIVIDEIDIWAPEKGHGEAESLGTIADLASRGRDKGFFLVAATQRISKFNKDVAAELGIKFIGKATLDNDQTRAAMELGIPTKEKTKLRDLGRPNFHFYAFGPGLSDDVIKMKSLPVQTTHVSGYKRNKSQKPIPTPAKIKSIISQFSDLPQEAEKEIKTKEEFQKKIHELETEKKKLVSEHKIQISHLEKIKSKSDPDELQNQYAKGYRDGSMKVRAVYEKFQIDTERTIKQMQQKYDSLVSIIDTLHQKSHTLDRIGIPVMPDIPIPVKLELPKEVKLPIRTDNIPAGPVVTSNVPPVITKSASASTENTEPLGECPRKILAALAQSGGSASRKKIAALSGYSVRKSTLRNGISALSRLGYVEKSGEGEKITDAGLAALGDYEPLPTDHESLLNHWMSEAGQCGGELLRELCNNYPNFISREYLGERTGYDNTKSTLRNGISKLNSLGLIEKNSKNEIRASEELFP